MSGVGERVKPTRDAVGSRATAGFALLAMVQVGLIFAITMLSPALPRLAQSLGLSVAGRTLAGTAYGVTFGGSLLLGGRLADRFGRRRVLQAGVVVFGAASLLGAFAWDPAALLSARFLQGWGAALAAPAALALVGDLFPDPERRGRAVATWGTLSAAGATAGTLFSGPITQVSWRLDFAVPVAVCMVFLAAAPRVLPAPAPGRAGLRLDLAGSVLVTGALAALAVGFGLAVDTSWSALRVWGPLAGGVVLLAVFGAVERTVAEPVLPPRLFAAPARAVALVSVLVASAGMASVFYFLSLHLQGAERMGPLLTSAAFLPFCATQLATGSVVGRAISAWGDARVLTVGLACGGVGLLLMAGLGLDGSYWGPMLAGLLIFPVGAVAVFAGATVAMVSGVDDALSTTAGAAVNTGMEIGPAVGLAALATVAAGWSASSSHHTASGGYAVALFTAGVVFLLAAMAAFAVNRSGTRNAGCTHLNQGSTPT